MDPRIIGTEVDDTSYCVVFWSSLPAERREEEPVAADEFLITDAADVEEVIAWARAEAGETKRIAVYAVLRDARIRLIGNGP